MFSVVLLAKGPWSGSHLYYNSYVIDKRGNQAVFRKSERYARDFLWTHLEEIATSIPKLFLPKLAQNFSPLLKIVQDASAIRIHKACMKAKLRSQELKRPISPRNPRKIEMCLAATDGEIFYAFWNSRSDHPLKFTGTRGKGCLGFICKQGFLWPTFELSAPMIQTLKVMNQDRKSFFSTAISISKNTTARCTLCNSKLRGSVSKDNGVHPECARDFSYDPKVNVFAICVRVFYFF
jgi:hypothetical protein